MTHNESAWYLIRISSIYLTSSRDNMQRSRWRLFNINIYSESASMTTTKTKKSADLSSEISRLDTEIDSGDKVQGNPCDVFFFINKGYHSNHDESSQQHPAHDTLNRIDSRDKKSLTLTLQVISFWCTRFLIQEAIYIVVQKSRIAHDIVDIYNVISSTVKAFAVALRCNVERRFEQNQSDAMKTRQFSFSKSPHRADLLVDCFPINVTFHIRNVLQFLLLVIFLAEFSCNIHTHCTRTKLKNGRKFEVVE